MGVGGLVAVTTGASPVMVVGWKETVVLAWQGSMSATVSLLPCLLRQALHSTTCGGSACMPDCGVFVSMPPVICAGH